jgi:hypothetical protein
MSGEYQTRIIEKTNLKLNKSSTNFKSYKNQGKYSGYIKDLKQNKYPFYYTIISSDLSDFHARSIQLKISKQYNNLPGIQYLQTYLQRRISHKPSIDELAEFIALYTIYDYRNTQSKRKIKAASASYQGAKIAIEALEKAQEAMRLASEAVEAAKALVESNTIQGCTADSDDDWETLLDD